MSLIDFVIGKQNLQSLAPAQQDAARAEARRQFIVNSLLGGRGLASGYAAAQQVVPGIQAAEQQRRMSEARQQSLVPTGRFQSTPLQGSQLDLLQKQMGGDTGVASLAQDTRADQLTTQALQSNVQRQNAAPGLGGTGFTPQRQLTPEMQLDERRFADLASLVLPASSISEILKNFDTVRPKINDQGVMTDIRGNVIGSIPTEEDFVQRQLNVSTGQFEATPVPGARRAQEAVRPAALSVGQQTDQGVVTTAPGYLASQADITANQTTAEQAARAPFELVTVTDASGRKRQISKAALLGSQGQAGQPGQPSQPGQPAGGSQLFSELGDLDRSRMKVYDTDLQNAGKQADAARAREVTFDRILQIYNNPNFDPDKLTTAKADVMGVLRGFGLTGQSAEDFLRDYGGARQAFGRLTLDALTEAVGAISNFEIGYYGNTMPRITDTKESTVFNIEVMKAAGNKAKARQKFLLDNPAADASTQWDESEQGRKSIFEDPKLLPFIKKYSSNEQKRVVTSGPNKGKTAYQMPDGRFKVIP